MGGLRVIASPTPPSGPCIFGLHPHGRAPMGIIPWLASRPDIFEDIVVAQSSLGKAVPMVGFVTMFSRVIDATRCIIDTLRKNKKVAIFPGGAKEMTLCEPYSQEIPIVQQTGFLRLAREQAIEMQKAGKTGPVVVPCFLFGMHDWYSQFLAKFDKRLYAATGLNVPFWWPLQAGSQAQKLMVVGEHLDPAAYSSEEELAEAYYGKVQQLFEMYKSDLPAYAHRNIKWIPVPKKASQDQRQRSNFTQKFTTVGQLVFIAINVAIFLRSGKFFRFSTLGFLPMDLHTTLSVHILAALLWTITSAVQTIKSNFRYHKAVGYLAWFSCVAMCSTALHLSALELHRALQMDDAWLAMHTIWHAYGNMTAAAGTMILLAYALAAAIGKDIKIHRRYMSMVHTSMQVLLLPRVTSRLVGWILPFFSSHANYSIAAAIQYIAMVAAPFLQSRVPLIRLNIATFVVTLMLMLIEMYGAGCRLSGLVGPIVTTVSGFMAFRFDLLGERKKTKDA